MTEPDRPARALRRRPVVVTIFNQKGGIGKTTTTVNLAVSIAAMGRSVAIVDLDSQSNATSSLGMTAPPAAGAYRLVVGGAALAEAMVATPFPNLWLCAASDELVGADIELAMADEPQTFLRRAIHDRPADIDIVVIDCPPALGMLPVNALVASDLALLPVSPEPLAREGLLKAWRHIHRIRANLNPSLEILGVLLTMVDRAAVHREFAATVRAEFGGRVLPMAVPRDSAVLAASAQEIPVAVFDPDGPAARAYAELAHWLLQACHRRTAGVRVAEAPDMPDWLESQASAFDPAAVRAVLLRWRDECTRDTLPLSAIAAQPDAMEDAPRPPHTSGRGRAIVTLLAGLVLGFALGAALPAITAQVQPYLP